MVILNDVEIFIKNFQKTPRKKFIADINGSKKLKYLVSKLIEINFPRELQHIGFFPNNKRNKFEELSDVL